MVSPRTQSWWALLNVVPLPGLAALWLGYRNPHTTLLRHGAVQMTLVVLGAYPLVIPGIVGFAWAIWDAVAIAKARLIPVPVAGPAPSP